MTQEDLNKEIENRVNRLDLATCKCAKCGQEIFWVKTKKGKFAPITLQLINHFADCKFADDFRKNENR